MEMNSAAAEFQIMQAWADVRKNWPAYSEVQKIAKPREAEITKQWQEWLKATYMDGLPAGVHDVIYSKAWEQGHSSGLHEVEMYYTEYADMAQAILDTARSAS